MKKYLYILISAAMALTIGQAHAAVSPVSFGILPPIQFPPDDFGITGVRVSGLWGHHRDLWGIDIGGLGNITDQTFTGLAVAGGVNVTKGQTTIIGLQGAGLGNFNTNQVRVYGLQVAAIMNSNKSSSSVTGLQAAGVNWAPHTSIYGFQVGIVNRALNVYGFQIGVVNIANSLRGIQIGLANFHHTGTFVVSPVLNIGF